MLRLKAITDELSVLNASLEEKVAERTQELEEAHATLRHTEKLSSLGRLAASVAHEINNPLTSLLSYVYLMKYELEEGSSLVKDLSVMERQINAIARLVRRLQDFSKPPRRERHPVQLSEVLEDVLTLLGKELEHQRVEVDYHQDEPLHPVLASPDQMGEVFMNLVLNARDAMPQGGELSLALENQEGVVVFRITDTGVGISPEVLDRLFEPFFTTKGDKGTGLGLAICYRIVEEHGGEMQVESAPGQGATFTIRLPALEEPQGQAHEGRGQGEGERDSHVH
jgi:two-component system NtrC family sensor kinase